MIRILAYLLVHAASLMLPVFAQESAVQEVPGRDMLVYIRHWTEEDGLSARRVTKVIRDHQGFLWVGTDAGLERFDGYSFKFYGRPQGLHLDAVGEVTVDAGGILWVCDQDADGTIGNLDLVDPGSGQIRSFGSVFGHDFPYDVGDLSQWCVARDSSIVMIHGKAGLQVWYHPRTGLRTYPWPKSLEPNIANVLDNGSVTAIVQHEDSSYAFVPVDRSGRIGPPLLTLPRGCVVIEVLDADAADGTFTYWTWTGLHWRSPVDQFRGDGRVKRAMGGVSAHFEVARAVLEFPENDWWCGASWRDANGVELLDLEGPWPGLRATFSSLRDGRDRLWIGSDFGLYQITVLPKRFERLLYTANDVITEGVRCRSIVPAGDVLHVNSERHGYWRLDRRSGDTLAHEGDTDCYGIAMDAHGGLHRSVDNELLIERNGHVTRIPLHLSAWAILPDPDGMGGLVGGENMMHRYDVRSASLVPQTSGGADSTLPGVHVLQFLRTRNMGVWASTNIGLVLLGADGSVKARYWTEGEGPYKLPIDRVNHVREGPDGRLWVATAGAGTLVVEPGKGVVATYDRSSGLPSNVIYASYADATGSLWMPTSRGLARLDPSTGRVSVFTTADGLTHDEFNRISHAQGPDGVLYFGGLNGITALDPAHMGGLASGPVAPLTITRFSKLAGAERQQEDLLPQFREEGGVELRPEDGQIELGFALLNYEPKEQVVYEWMIEGENASWSVLNEPYLRFGRLPYGEKALLVRARSGRTVRQPQELRIPIHVMRPLYLRWWAIAGALVLMGGATVLLFRVRVARVRREYALRDRIAMDLHDEVGSTLSGISLTANVARKRVTTDKQQAAVLLDEIADNTSATMDAMHDIVWAINARYDDLDSMVARMRHHAGRVCEVKGIELHFTADERASKVKLDMVQRRNTYLVFKEAVNNALKYSQCTAITIDLRLDRELVLRIADNGKGFIMEAVDNEPSMGHNGLRNMHKRAHEIDGHVEIVSAPRQGTQISFRFTP